MPGECLWRDRWRTEPASFLDRWQIFRDHVCLDWNITVRSSGKTALFRTEKGGLNHGIAPASQNTCEGISLHILPHRNGCNCILLPNTEGDRSDLSKSTRRRDDKAAEGDE